MTNIVAVSGGFDPLHDGHIDYLKGAWEIAQINDAKVMVILNGDRWLEKKGHGHPYYTYKQRAKILEALIYVDLVVPQIGEDMSITESLKVYQPSVFAKGGDRTLDTLPKDEVEACNQLGITLITGVGGTDKPNSSRWIIEKIKNGER